MALSGRALFSSILSVSATVYAPTVNSVIQVPFAALTAISSDLRNVTVTAVQGTMIYTLLISGSVTASYAPAGTQIMCTVVGTYST